MAGQLLLRLPRDPGVAIAWLACDDGDVVAQGADALVQATAHAEDRQLIAMVPGDCVLLTRVAVPSRKDHHIRQAVPYLLEEQLAADVNSLHFAIGPRDADGTVAVAVVDRELLATWLDTLITAGLEPEAMIPETLALPDPEAGWWLAADDTIVLLRRGELAGYAMDRDAAPALLRMALADAEIAPASISLCGIEPDELLTGDDELPELHPAAAADLPTLLAHHAPADPCDLDLRQGPFARARENSVTWHDWRRAAALAACLLLLLFGQRWWQLQQLESESARLEGELAATRQRLARLRGGGSDGRFLDLLAASGNALAKEQGWQLAGLNYRDGTLQLQLRMPGFDHFERLRGRFVASDGVTAEIGSLGSVEGEVRGSVTLREPDA
jgi:general secretion pathway protein L